MTVRSALTLLAPVVLGIVVGYLLGGRLSDLASLRFRALWLLWLAAAIQACQYWVPPVRTVLEDRLHTPMLALVFAVVAVWLAVNLQQNDPWLRPAVAAIVLGAALNGLVVLTNGSMPFSARAAQIAGMPASVVTPKNHIADDHTRLAFMGDVIPLPGLRKVLSPGDLLIILGAAGAIAVSMRHRPSILADLPRHEMEVTS